LTLLWSTSMASQHLQGDGAQRQRSICQTVEYYFSDTNLSKDSFFRDLVMADPDGWVDAAAFIFTCRRMEQLSVDRANLSSALAASGDLETRTQFDLYGACVECQVRRLRPFQYSESQETKGGGKGKGREKGCGKATAGRGGRQQPEYEPWTPCGYFIAGYCKRGRSCFMQHSVPYAIAIRHEWLNAGDPTAQEDLRKQAIQTLGAQALSDASLFPRVFSRRLLVKPSALEGLSRHNHGVDAGKKSQPRWGRRQGVPCDEALDDDGGFEWERASADDNAADLGSARPVDGSLGQAPPRYLLVLDLEGKDEIIEFPVIAVDTVARQEVGRFQRYVRPVQLFEGRVLTSDSPALPFPTVLEEFDAWLRSILGHGLWDMPQSTAFLTCGDWDCHHVHTQCGICRISVPSAFTRWVNIKRAYAKFYGAEFRGMKSMLSRLGMLDKQGNVKHGFHHLGMHDVENIGRCLLHLLNAGEEVQINGFRRDRTR